jgi:hypothetical protein
MQIGDMVQNLNSESKMTGIIVGWKNEGRYNAMPMVLWADGRLNWVMQHLIRGI